jgi:ABC-2 type transport system permease protein
VPAASRAARGVDEGTYLASTGWLLVAAVALTVIVSATVAAAAGCPSMAGPSSRSGPMTAGLAVQATTGLRHLPIRLWAGLGVLAGWAAAAFLADVLLLRLRTRERRLLI